MSRHVVLYRFENDSWVRAYLIIMAYSERNVPASRAPCSSMKGSSFMVRFIMMSCFRDDVHDKAILILNRHKTENFSFDVQQIESIQVETNFLMLYLNGTPNNNAMNLIQKGRCMGFGFFLSRILITCSDVWTMLLLLLLPPRVMLTRNPKAVKTFCSISCRQRTVRPMAN